jgi:hypothetical protein
VATAATRYYSNNEAIGSHDCLNVDLEDPLF